MAFREYKLVEIRKSSNARDSRILLDALRRGWRIHESFESDVATAVILHRWRIPFLSGLFTALSPPRASSQAISRV